MSEPPRTPPRRAAPALGSATRSPGTPRRHKVPSSKSTQGTRRRTAKYATAKVKSDLKEAFSLPFEPDDWQAELISRVLRGYDSIFCAGTGYGKSLVFQALAKLGGKNKAVLVICPLKALEADQVREAEAKGLRAVMINEDNSKTREAWAEARTKAQMIYISPEMALSDSFTKLWKDGKFRDRVQAVVIDEAHCVDEWGKDDFRKQYRQLKYLRHYTGHSIPFVACTATCSSATFDTLWETLGYGYRPFWGIDVGSDRPNLFFDTRPITNKANPVIDVLGILPPSFSSDTPLDAVPKCILYFESENACLQAKITLRKCLPAHLRDTVYAFSSSISEKAKRQVWDRFREGSLRILCATDAAGMGCNVPDIQYVIIIGCPRSLSVVAQRWGRAGRDRSTPATCLLLVPKWAFRPDPAQSAVVNPAIRRVRKTNAATTTVKQETKKDAEQRARLPAPLEQFINVNTLEGQSRCSHAYVGQAFRPNTRLDNYRLLDNSDEPTRGSRASAFELSWTTLDLGRHPLVRGAAITAHRGIPISFPPARMMTAVCEPMLPTSRRPLSSCRVARLPGQQARLHLPPR
ncbi:P-loop containing nucleoside triphosphate hydrolase protein [Fomitopsis serialis]|uniref:P-loop containing nucleoside triphosphate hydrolase protein n=1 Tax=Fomitopsis serialis TaxID=139415 RepID=UPI002007CFDE|nr:P-loop containing nucleoside triphosphate hydrolase protein [Neoantrodia serialis]KAH9922989.1 P-loop containing nucleoside triphosphate hydrolase protein [Neoantrodia serialis]